MNLQAVFKLNAEDRHALEELFGADVIAKFLSRYEKGDLDKMINEGGELGSIATIYKALHAEKDNNVALQDDLETMKAIDFRAGFKGAAPTVAKQSQKEGSKSSGSWLPNFDWRAGFSDESESHEKAQGDYLSKAERIQANGLKAAIRELREEEIASEKSKVAQRTAWLGSALGGMAGNGDQSKAEGDPSGFVPRFAQGK